VGVHEKHGSTCMVWSGDDAPSAAELQQAFRKVLLPATASHPEISCELATCMPGCTRPRRCGLHGACDAASTLLLRSRLEVAICRGGQGGQSLQLSGGGWGYLLCT
jgi:hypothetical protein